VQFQIRHGINGLQKRLRLVHPRELHAVFAPGQALRAIGGRGQGGQFTQIADDVASAHAARV